MAFSSSSSSSLSAVPNVTPLIDVLLVLLIIFMVIVPISPRGLESTLPSPAPSAAEPQPRTLLIEVLSVPSGHVAYRIAGHTFGHEALRTALRSASAQGTVQPVFIQAARELDYQPVVRVISEVHQAGFRLIGLLPLASAR